MRHLARSKRSSWWLRVFANRASTVVAFVTLGATICTGVWISRRYSKPTDSERAADTAKSNAATPPHDAAMSGRDNRTLVPSGDLTAALATMKPVAMLESPGAFGTGSSAQSASGSIRYGVRIEGHNIPDDAAYVLRVLESAGQLETRKEPLETADGLCALYIERLQFPGQCVEGLRTLARSLNASRTHIDAIPHGAPVRVPTNIVFKADNYFERYDPQNRFDRKRMDRDLDLRAAYVKSQESVRGGMRRVEYAGTRLEFERPHALPESVVKTLVKSRRNIYLTRVESSATTDRFFSAGESDDFYNRWCLGATSGAEFAYVKLLGSDDDVDQPCPAQSSCADVVLIDTDLHNNPKIANALPDHYQTAADEPMGNPPLKCVSTINEQKHHGTFLAGLIASARNKTGFWGVHSGARLQPIHWNIREERTIAQALIARDEHQSRKQLYVFASSWEPEPAYTNGAFITDDRDEDDVQRAVRYRPEMARAIKGIGGLWIVAAGQRSSSKLPILRVDKRLKYGPMNLGDRPNVLVVTGCDNCGADATLWSEARRGSGKGMQMVHVAAPATRIPGIVNNGQYAMVMGTSPATALVAGIASAYIARYGQHFNSPQWLKRRLQYTSTPSLGDEEAKTVAAGVIDARTAMRDPTKTWLDITASGWNEMREVSVAGWCRQAFTMGRVTSDGFIPLTHYPHVRVRDVFRIVRDRRTASTETRWFVYSRYPDFEGDENPGEVLRIGPAIAAERNNPLLKLADRVVRMGEIEDLLVSDVGTKLGVVSCPAQ